MALSRRGFIGGLLTAPVVIRTPGLLMPIKPARLSRSVFVDWEAFPRLYVGPLPFAELESVSASSGGLSLETRRYLADLWADRVRLGGLARAVGGLLAPSEPDPLALPRPDDKAA
ncbi:MAG: hypothetical protein ACEQSH_00205 [Bacteroidia bacterium]